MSFMWRSRPWTVSSSSLRVVVVVVMVVVEPGVRHRGGV
jgi:hypothetical protein